MEWLLGVSVGVFVGALGIGGVLIVPILTLFLGREIGPAIATASSSFLLPAAVAVFEYHRRGVIPWRLAAPMCAACVPGVVVGVALGLVLPGAVLALATSALLLIAGLQALRPGPTAGTGVLPDRILALTIGASVGAASALTGTGGPVLLSPILLWLRVPVRTVIGVSQAIALPIAAMASLAYGWSGRVDFELAATLGVSQAVGVPIGAALAHRVPVKPLHRAVVLAILVSAALLAMRGLGDLTSG